jgi:uncharacterized protein
MTAAANKAIVEAVFAALAEGDGRPFNAAMAEDILWIVEGSGPWARAYRGKAAVIEELQKPVFANFATRYKCRAERIIAEGDDVVVLARGEAVTRAGKRYDNSYCFVIRMRGGEMAELREYMDTELVAATLEMPSL